MVGHLGDRYGRRPALLLTMAFLARQAWGWVADRIGGLNTVLAGNGGEVLHREREERPVGQRVAVEQEEPGTGRFVGLLGCHEPSLGRSRT